MTEATPGPWEVEQDGDGKFLIVAPREHDNLLITGVLANLTPGQDEANAALFVRAVNNLDPLVEHLERMIDDLSSVAYDGYAHNIEPAIAALDEAKEVAS